MERILLKGGAVVLSERTREADLLIEDGKIAAIAPDISAEDAKVYNISGLTVMAGFTDMHTHLREPGFEHKEDVESGTRAAVKGGFTAVCCMPNTNPVIDSAPLVRYLKLRGKECNLAKVYPIGCITKGQKGAELAEMGKMLEAGAVAFSDDGCPVENANTMRLALEYAKGFDALLISHCEEKTLADGWVNEGTSATLAGLKGISRAAEEVMVAREILLADALKTKVHIAHISTEGSVALVRWAKERGVAVTAETCPHYFSADDSMILTFDTNTKVNPPLRTQADVEAIIEGLRDGTIDVIATDHAPHHVTDKQVEYQYAANGISGLETAFSLAYTHLVKEGRITLQRLSELMSRQPNRILKLGSGVIKPHAPADITVVDLNAEYTIDPAEFVSKGKNTPFCGADVFGRVKMTFVDGDLKYSEIEE